MIETPKVENVFWCLFVEAVTIISVLSSNSKPVFFWYFMILELNSVNMSPLVARTMFSLFIEDSRGSLQGYSKCKMCSLPRFLSQWLLQIILSSPKFLGHSVNLITNYFGLLMSSCESLSLLIILYSYIPQLLLC